MQMQSHANAVPGRLKSVVAQAALLFFANFLFFVEPKTTTTTASKCLVAGCPYLTRCEAVLQVLRCSLLAAPCWLLLPRTGSTCALAPSDDRDWLERASSLPAGDLEVEVIRDETRNSTG